MDTQPHILCTVTPAMVEVVTSRTDDGGYVTQINHGPLDGERYFCRRNPRWQHERACLLAEGASKG